MTSAYFANVTKQLEDFVVEPRPFDVLAFGALVLAIALLLAIAGLSVLTSCIGAPETFMSPLPDQPCGEPQPGTRMPTCHNITRSYVAGTMTYAFDVLIDETAIGQLSFSLDEDLRFSVIDAGGRASGAVTFIERAPMVRVLGIYNTQVNVTRTRYGRVFAAAVAMLGKSSRKTVSEDASAQLGQSIFKSVFGEEQVLGQKTVRAEKASAFLGWIQAVTYLAAAFAVVGYILLALLCKLASQGKRHVKEDFRTAVGSRLNYFDFVVDALPALGLLGTMIGMVSAFEGITLADSTDVLVATAARSQLFGGIQYAVWTTIIALVLMLVIKLVVCLPINHFLVHRVTKVFRRVKLR